MRPRPKEPYPLCVHFALETRQSRQLNTVRIKSDRFRMANQPALQSNPKLPRSNSGRLVPSQTFLAGRAMQRTRRWRDRVAPIDGKMRPARSCFLATGAGAWGSTGRRRAGWGFGDERRLTCGHGLGRRDESGNRVVLWRLSSGLRALDFSSRSTLHRWIDSGAAENRRGADGGRGGRSARWRRGASVGSVY